VDDAPRTRVARVAAEAALVRVVHHYGERPEFVVLGGLVPELLCSVSPYGHAGTRCRCPGRPRDHCGHCPHRPAGTRPPQCGVPTRCRVSVALVADGLWSNVVVRFELLADLDDLPEGVTVIFDGCQDLGAANLRGTGYAARDVEIRQLTSKIGGVLHKAEVNVSGVAGLLLAKIAAAIADDGQRTGMTSHSCSFAMISAVRRRQLPPS